MSDKIWEISNSGNKSEIHSKEFLNGDNGIHYPGLADKISMEQLFCSERCWKDIFLLWHNKYDIDF